MTTALVVEAYCCGLSILYRLPYVKSEDVLSARCALIEERITDHIIHSYLSVCAENKRLGIFEDLGIKVTEVNDPSEGQLWQGLQERWGAPRLGTGDRLVSARIEDKSLKGQYPAAHEAAIAMVYWTCKLWHGDASNDWLDHYHAYTAWQNLQQRGFRREGHLNDLDNFGRPLHLVLCSPRTASIAFDLAERRLQLNNVPGKGYLDDEVPFTSRAGLTRAYTTDMVGVHELMQDFEVGGCGHVPEIGDSSVLTVCISYRHFSVRPPDDREASQEPFSRISHKARVQLAIFLLSMHRFYRKIRFWCDAVLKSRRILCDDWETVGLVPYLTWPTLYISGYTEEPETNSFNRLWVRIEQFCAGYGRGAYVMSFDVLFLNESNPWSRGTGPEVLSVWQAESGRFEGRHEGAHNTLYLLCRAVRYGLFDEFCGTWAEYFDHKFKCWLEREERRLTWKNHVVATPFVFNDGQLTRMEIPSTIIFKPRRIRRGHEPLPFEDLMRPQFDSDMSREVAVEESSFVHGEVWRTLGCDGGEDVYIVVTRPSSRFGNCWMCEVRYNDGVSPRGILKQVVHYVSCNGRLFPGVVDNVEEFETCDDKGIWMRHVAGDVDTEDLSFEWFSEAADVISKSRGKSKSDIYLQMRGVWGGQRDSRVKSIRIKAGLPSLGPAAR